MLGKVITGLNFMFISLTLFANRDEIIQVDVLNKSQVVLSVLKNSEDIKGFQKIWEDKAIVKGLSNIGYWDYLLDIQTKVISIQWRYDSKTGLCSLFSKKKMPLYRIRSFEILNKVLHALPHEKISWVVENEPLDMKHEPWIPPYDSREGRREYRERRDESNKREEKDKSQMPDFNPSLESESDEDSEDDNWGNDSRLICISLKEARRRRDDSRAKAEALTQMDSKKLPGIRGNE